MKLLTSKIIFALLFIATSKFSYAQGYLLPNEKKLFSFSTKDNKKMVLARDSVNKYIIYRFGGKDNIEFEFPDKTSDSWSKFTYSFYLRGGEEQNEGMDLNYVYFMSENVKYIIYDTYYSQDEKSQCGIKILKNTTNKTHDIGGIIKTKKGDLTDFRSNELLKMTDDIFD